MWWGTAVAAWCSPLSTVIGFDSFNHSAVKHQGISWAPLTTADHRIRTAHTASLPAVNIDFSAHLIHFVRSIRTRHQFTLAIHNTHTLLRRVESLSLERKRVCTNVSIWVIADWQAVWAWWPGMADMGSAFKASDIEIVEALVSQPTTT